MWDRLKTSKTFWTSLAGIVTLIGAGFMGEMPWLDVVRDGLVAVLAIFVRDGVAKALPARPL